MFGIPSDGCEGLAMKQRYRALHPNINQLRSIPAPKIKKDNYHSATNVGSHSPVEPSDGSDIHTES